MAGSLLTDDFCNPYTICLLQQAANILYRDQVVESQGSGTLMSAKAKQTPEIEDNMLVHKSAYVIQYTAKINVNAHVSY